MGSGAGGTGGGGGGRGGSGSAAGDGGGGRGGGNGVTRTLWIWGMCCHCCLGGGRRSPIAPRSTWPPRWAAGSPAALWEGSGGRGGGQWEITDGAAEGLSPSASQPRAAGQPEPENWDTQRPPRSSPQWGCKPVRTRVQAETAALGHVQDTPNSLCSSYTYRPCFNALTFSPLHAYFSFQLEVGLQLPALSCGLLPHLH